MIQWSLASPLDRDTLGDLLLVGSDNGDGDAECLDAVRKIAP